MKYKESFFVRKNLQDNEIGIGDFNKGAPCKMTLRQNISILYLSAKPSNLAIWFSGGCTFNLPQSSIRRSLRTRNDNIYTHIHTHGKDLAHARHSRTRDLAFSLRERYWTREVLKICPHTKLPRINLPCAHARRIDSHTVSSYALASIMPLTSRVTLLLLGIDWVKDQRILLEETAPAIPALAYRANERAR